MNIISGFVLFAVVWFLVLFVVLPIRLETQGDRGEIEPGTHAGAPAEFDLMKKVKIVTLAAIVVWMVIAGIVLSGWITVEDLDWFDRMNWHSSEPK
jgi:predicted secreted protein